jgi:hypothetical protein
MAKKVDPKAKAKRQKIILACSGVLLVLLLALQGPKTLKMLNAKPPADESHAPVAAPAAPAVAPTSPAVLAPTQAPAQAAAVVTPDGVGIPNTTQAPVPASGQLVAFSRFKSKDPFVQQVGAADSNGTSSDTPATGSAAAATATAPPTTTATAMGAPALAPTAPPAATMTVTPTTPATQSAASSGAKISVNGVAEQVALRASFPKSSPTFRLVSFTKTEAKIGLVGGSYSDGGATITLKLGKVVTLMNTADGTRYKLRFLSAG